MLSGRGTSLLLGKTSVEIINNVSANNDHEV